MVIVLGNYVVITVFVDCIYNVLLYMFLLTLLVNGDDVGELF